MREFMIAHILVLSHTVCKKISIYFSCMSAGIDWLYRKPLLKVILLNKEDVLCICQQKIVLMTHSHIYSVVWQFCHSLLFLSCVWTIDTSCFFKELQPNGATQNYLWLHKVHHLHLDQIDSFSAACCLVAVFHSQWFHSCFSNYFMVLDLMSWTSLHLCSCIDQHSAVSIVWHMLDHPLLSLWVALRNLNSWKVREGWRICTRESNRKVLLGRSLWKSRRCT